MVGTLVTWAPRILGILFAVFLGAFALDVFSEGYALADLLFALLIHLLPALAVLAALVIAWLFPLWGAGAFFILSIFTYFFFHTYRHPISFFLISFPPLLIATLFALQSWMRK